MESQPSELVEPSSNPGHRPQGVRRIHRLQGVMHSLRIAILVLLLQLGKRLIRVTIFICFVIILILLTSFLPHNFMSLWLLVNLKLNNSYAHDNYARSNINRAIIYSISYVVLLFSALTAKLVTIFISYSPIVFIVYLESLLIFSVLLLN